MDVVTMSLDKAGARKAAIFVASLEAATADALLSRLAPEQADFVRQAVASLDQIGRDDRQRVAEEFLRIGPMVPQASPAGIELDAPPPRRFSGSPLSDSAVGPTNLPPFDFLARTEDRRLIELLRDERPATVALVLTHLPPKRAGEVLANFEPAMQVEVVRRMADIESTDDQTVREIERALETRWSNQAESDDEQGFNGMATVARILEACNPASRGQILQNLASRDESLAKQFGRPSITFDDLARFDDAVLLAVVRAASAEMVEAALLGAPPAILDRFLRVLPPHERKRLQKKLSHPEPIRLSDVEEARRQIAALAQDLAVQTSNRPSFAA
jgi:flagellar motor switch protein FliG